MKGLFEMFKIPVAKPDLSGNEEKYVLDAIRSSWISSSGQYLERFERDFASLCAVDTSIGVCNGTVALHLTMLALDVRPGDEVLLPSLTYIATANAVRYVGAEPVFVDVDPNTWCIDPKLIEKKITSKTKGIIPVHLYGHPADMDEINKIAETYNLWVVEDAAEAHFAEYKGKKVGSFGNLATFSFYGNKTFTCGEGGALTINDKSLVTKMKMLRGQGMDPNRRYYFPIIGYNYRLTNVAAAILCAQIERLEKILEKRRLIFDMYKERLAEVDGIIFQPKASWANISPWLFCILIEEEKYGMSRDELMRCLQEAGIETRPFFIPLHQMPPYQYLNSNYEDTELQHTIRIAKMGVNLPTYNMLQQDEINYICEKIISFKK